MTSSSGTAHGLNVQRADGILTLELDAPSRRNALTVPVLGAIADELAHLDPGIRVVVVTASGSPFSAGSDLREAASTNERAEAYVRAFRNIEQSTVPVLAAVAGDVYGAAIGLVAACDIVVAAGEVRFAFPEVRHGTVATIAAVPCLRRVRPAALSRLLMTGRPFVAEEAHELGLADVVVEAAELEEAVDALAAEVRLGAPGAVATTKRLLHVLTAGTTTDPYAVAVSESLRLSESREMAEGRSAFADRRAPSWRN